MKTNYVLQNPHLIHHHFQLLIKLEVLQWVYVGQLQVFKEHLGNPGSQYMLKGGTKYYGFSSAACSFDWIYERKLCPYHIRIAQQVWRTQVTSSSQVTKSHRVRQDIAVTSLNITAVSLNIIAVSLNIVNVNAVIVKNLNVSDAVHINVKRQRGGYSQYLSNTPNSSWIFHMVATISPFKQCFS